MADITAISQIPNGTELTAAQITAIINRIDINIYNILANKWDALDYAEFGQAGHRAEPTKLLAELREQRKFWNDKLDGFPAIEYTQFDVPDI